MRALMLAAALALTAGAAQAQTLTGAALASALRSGGYVLVMRHAHSPTTPPEPAAAEPRNTGRERQLDDAGKRDAKTIGEAIKALRLPVGQVWSSPTFRALQTVRLAGLPSPTAAPELGDAGQSMQALGAGQGAWLRAKAEAAPAAGTDTVIVTHLPNISAAFGDAAMGLGDGEALVFHPASPAGDAPVARIKVEDWPALAGGR